MSGSFTYPQTNYSSYYAQSPHPLALTYPEFCTSYTWNPSEKEEYSNLRDYLLRRMESESLQWTRTSYLRKYIERQEQRFSIAYNNYYPSNQYAMSPIVETCPPNVPQYVPAKSMSTPSTDSTPSNEPEDNFRDLSPRVLKTIRLISEEFERKLQLQLQLQRN